MCSQSVEQFQHSAVPDDCLFFHQYHQRLSWPKAKTLSAISMTSISHSKKSFSGRQIFPVT